jgi:hypothetical protein
MILDQDMWAWLWALCVSLVILKIISFLWNEVRCQRTILTKKLNF